MPNTPNAPRQLPPLDFTIGDLSGILVTVEDDGTTTKVPTEWTPIGPWEPGPTIVIPNRR